ncbi:MAG: prolipoprotein diacylglyceryl transferase [Planctomycetes bacterium]|nr:prolipoprotein diacylglyceryl transferase [Planctomycetota bacterium]
MTVTPVGVERRQERTMFPKVGPIPTYGILYFGAIALHFVLILLFGRRVQVRWYIAAALGLCFVVGMTVGAKALFDVLHGGLRPRLLVSTAHYMQGGMWGGPLAYLAMAVPLACLLTARRGAAMDAIAWSLPLPMILAKLGCLCQDCCHGRACDWPWAFRFPPGGSAPAGTPLHPTQVYEIIVLTMILVAFVLLDRPAWRGLMLPWFVLLYGLGRSLVELWRGDRKNTLMLGPVSVAQVVLLSAAAIALVVLAILRSSRRSQCQPAEGTAPDPGISSLE